MGRGRRRAWCGKGKEEVGTTVEDEYWGRASPRECDGGRRNCVGEEVEGRSRRGGRWGDMKRGRKLGGGAGRVVKEWREASGTRNSWPSNFLLPSRNIQPVPLKPPGLGSSHPTRLLVVRGPSREDAAGASNATYSRPLSQLMFLFWAPHYFLL